jgi:hypothetical protein
MGIEPTYAAWEAAVLPLNYTRVLQRILDDTVEMLVWVLVGSSWSANSKSVAPGL